MPTVFPTVLGYDMPDKHDPQTPPLSFLNTDFLKSPAARTIRMIAEYMEPAERLRRAGIRDTIVFFGSARSPSPEDAARQLAEIDQEVAGAGGVTAELREARTRAEAAVR